MIKNLIRYITLTCMITLLTSCGKTPDEDLGKIPEETVLTGTEPNMPAAAKNTPYGIPPYDGSPNTPINNDIPFFTEDDLIMTPFENYSELDELGRCGTAYANICTETMPKKPREDISEIKPTGWVQNKYPDLIDDEWIYNRCHLIGFQLSGENANEKNLITGTRYMNTEGMLGLENSIADYIRMNPENHVLYRVTPVFKGNDLLCQGVLMEAESVEDHGRELRFCRFAYNIQPGIKIDYSTGNNQTAQ